MRNFILRFLITAAALWSAAYIIGGINIVTTVPNLIYTAAIFGLINALIKPVIRFFTCPLQLLTLGAFTFVINGLMLMLTGRITGSGFTVDGFLPAFLGGLIISIVSTALTMWLIDEPKTTIEIDGRKS